MVRQEDDKSVTRYDCEHCNLRTEVDNVRNWLGSVDRKQWFGITLAITNLLAAVGALLVIIFKLMPAIASAAASAVK